REDRNLWHRDGFKYAPQYAPRWNLEAQKKAYQEGLRTDWDNPNSVDIHGTRHIVNLKAYFSKEISKSPDIAKPGRPGEKCPVCGGAMVTIEGNFRCDDCSYSKTHVSGMLWGCSVILYDTPISSPPAWDVPLPPDQFTLTAIDDGFRCVWDDPYDPDFSLKIYLTLPLRQSSLKLRRSLFYVGARHPGDPLDFLGLITYFQNLANVTWGPFFA
ncbi:unnamed protein product, partial [marine sediment metagenome]